jgi:hypothetical protein
MLATRRAEFEAGEEAMARKQLSQGGAPGAATAAKGRHKATPGSLDGGGVQS